MVGLYTRRLFDDKKKKKRDHNHNVTLDGNFREGGLNPCLQVRPCWWVVKIIYFTDQWEMFGRHWLDGRIMVTGHTIVVFLIFTITIFSLSRLGPIQGKSIKRYSIPTVYLVTIILKVVFRS